MSRCHGCGKLADLGRARCNKCLATCRDAIRSKRANSVGVYGECVSPLCHGVPSPGLGTCERCLLAVRKSKQKSRSVKKGEGICSASDCYGPAAGGLKSCAHHRVLLNKNAATHRAKARVDILNAYGGSCACCNESISGFLSIDHVVRYSGVGPRKSTQLYSWLRRNGFPDGFRILCMNCNVSLAMYGYCPHGDLCQIPVGNRAKDSQGRYIKATRRQASIVFDKYGQICTCCGITNLEFLCIDHVNNDGAAHRKNIKGNMYKWAIDNSYPKNIQILCTNCNFAKGRLGYCPHTVK